MNPSSTSDRWFYCRDCTTHQWILLPWYLCWTKKPPFLVVQGFFRRPCYFFKRIRLAYEWFMRIAWSMGENFRKSRRKHLMPITTRRPWKKKKPREHHKKNIWCCQWVDGSWNKLRAQNDPQNRWRWNRHTLLFSNGIGRVLSSLVDDPENELTNRRWTASPTCFKHHFPFSKCVLAQHPTPRLWYWIVGFSPMKRANGDPIFLGRGCFRSKLTHQFLLITDEPSLPSYGINVT